MSDSVRLAKQLAQQLSCSRREAELYIERGWVSVDGSTIEEPGYRVQPDQILVLSPEARLEDIPSVTLLFGPAFSEETSCRSDACDAFGRRRRFGCFYAVIQC